MANRTDYCAAWLRETSISTSAQGLNDEQLVEYFAKHVTDEQRDAANRYVLEERQHHLDDQDAEQGRR